jgi:hypothetical protein
MPKYIDIKEFREQGYLQEVNRTFLHPLGLALEVTINTDGTEYISGIWDYRGDDEGIHYGLIDSDEERINRFHENSKHVTEQWSTRADKRFAELGYVMEPIPEDDQ